LVAVFAHDFPAFPVSTIHRQTRSFFMKARTPILAAALLVVGSLAATSLLAGTPLEDRSQGFKGAKENMKQIKAALAAKDMAAVGVAAKSLQEFAGKIPGLFPEGSGGGKSEAKPEIWKNFADFQGKAKDLENASAKLGELAAAGNADAVAAQFKAVSGTCGSCHDSYKMD
jgi:cytochrome c556